MDDLDLLLDDLNRKSTGPSRPLTQQVRPISTRVDLHELEDLMEDLAAPTPMKMPEVTSVQQVPESQPQELNMEDLDLLMESLSASSRRQSVRPTSTRNLVVQEPTLRRELLGQSSSSSMNLMPDSNSGPTSSPVAPSTHSSMSFGPPSATTNSMTSNNVEPSMKVSTYSGNATYNVPESSGGSDLDSLLNNLSNQMSSISKGSPTIRGTCATCQQGIMGEMISAMGKAYHPEHFSCLSCRDPVSTDNFYEKNGSPMCEKCYRSHCAICAHCNEPIIDRCIHALGRKWHRDHFVCTTCNQPFASGQFYEREGRPYCERDYQATFSPKCGACSQPITKECINALGQQWHPEHFVCTHCQKSFAGGSFYEVNGKPYCETHYHQQSGSLCSGCGNPITGRCVNALGKKWHPEHFVCAFCMNALAGGAFSEHNNKAYCKGCHNSLFSG